MDLASCKDIMGKSQASCETRQNSRHRCFGVALKKEFELRRLKELKDRVQTIAIGILTQGKRSIFENIY